MKRKHILSPLLLMLVVILSLTSLISPPVRAAESLESAYSEVFEQFRGKVRDTRNPYIIGADSYWSNDISEVSYTFYDIDNNGVAELVFVTEGGAGDIYTLADGRGVQLCYWPGYRDAFIGISETGYMYGGGSMSAFEYGISYYRIAPDGRSSQNYMNITQKFEANGTLTFTVDAGDGYRVMTESQFAEFKKTFESPDVHLTGWKTLTDESGKPAGPTAGADSWAKAELEDALDIGIVPDSIAMAGWKNASSRLTAAEAIVAVIEKVSGKTMAAIAAERGWDLSKNGFSDTDSKHVTFLKYAGVTNGVGGNKYDPDSGYTRAQAVTMIGRAAEVFFDETLEGTNPFVDVPDWAAPYVSYAAECGITNGVGEGRFDSNGTLQNQHTALFCLRAYNAWQK